MMVTVIMRSPVPASSKTEREALSNMRTGTRLVLSALLSIAMSFSPDVRSMVRHPSCASSRNHIHMQLDHHGDRAFDDVSLASVNDLWIYDDDDMVLAAVEAKLEMAKRVPLADLRNDKQNDRHLHFTGEDEGCYLLSECAEGNKMFFSCSSFPVENDNLTCELQADGMDWICHNKYRA